jgi:hypothetical protein
MTIKKAGHPIQDLTDWASELAQEREALGADRTAMEAARSWPAVTSPGIPPEVAAVLAGRLSLRCQFRTGTPSLKLAYC